MNVSPYKLAVKMSDRCSGKENKDEKCRKCTGSKVESIELKAADEWISR